MSAASPVDVLVSVQAIADFVGGSLSGDASLPIEGVCTLQNPKPRSLCFAQDIDAMTPGDPRFDEALIVGPLGIEQVAPGAAITVDNPRLAYALAVAHFFHQRGAATIADSARISPSARLGRDVTIGEGCVIGPQVTIGDETELRHNVVIGAAVKIGSRCIVGSNSVIGEVGFGLAKDGQGRNVRIPHVGSVVIGDEVEIGALTSIAAGTIDPTVISDRVKIDDHVFIAHNCFLGEDVIVIAGAEISGSVRIGARTWVGPAVSIRDRVTIPGDTFLGIGCTVVKTLVEPGTYIGSPASIMPSSPSADRS